MAVTDLTDSLPWWARNGSGAAQGAGPTGTPSATPMGAGGQPGSGDSASWLQYLSQMFGVSPAQAGELSQNGLPLGATWALNHGGTPPVNNSINAGVVPPAGAPQQQPPGPPVGAGMLDQSGVVRMGGPNGVLNTQPPTGASAPVGASLLDQSGVGRSPAGVLTPGVNPNAPAPNAQPVSAAAPVPGALAAGGAAGTASTSNPRFIGIDRPNADPTARRGSPQGTALNLAGLFGGGQPAAAPAAAPGARPKVAGPLAGGGMVPSTYPGDNWDIDAQGNVVPNYGSPTSTTGPLQRPPKSSVARARILAPNYYG